MGTVYPLLGHGGGEAFALAVAVFKSGFYFRRLGMILHFRGIVHRIEQHRSVTVHKRKAAIRRADRAEVILSAFLGSRRRKDKLALQAALLH